MNDTPVTSPPETVEPIQKAIFISYFWKGKDNGVPKEGIDSRVINLPTDVLLKTAADIKTVADAIAGSEFNAEKRYTDLEITITNICSLPV